MPHYRKKKSASSRKRSQPANQRTLNRKKPLDESQAVENKTEEITLSHNNAQSDNPVSKIASGVYPVKIVSDTLSEVWHKFDVRAGMFKSHVNVHYMSPVPFECPDKYVNENETQGI